MDNESKAGAKMAESQSSLDSVSTVFVNAMCAIVIVCFDSVCGWDFECEFVWEKV